MISRITKSFSYYWRNGNFRYTRIPFLLSLYGLVVSLPIIIGDIYFHRVPLWLRNTNITIVLVNCLYCLVVAVLARRKWKQAERDYLKSREDLTDIIRPKLLRLSVLLNYRERPSVVELAHAAQVVYACRQHKLEDCDAELALVDAWVRYWDEEKVQKIEKTEKPPPSGKPNLKLQMTTTRSQPFYNHMNLPPGAAADFPLPPDVMELVRAHQLAGAEITTESEEPIEFAPKEFKQEHHIKADGKILATIRTTFGAK